jgi:Cytochrome P460
MARHVSARFGPGRAGTASLLALLLVGLALDDGAKLVGVAAAQGESGAQRAHINIADPASLSGARAEAVYAAIRGNMRDNYARSGDPVTTEYFTWTRYNKVPYRSPNHGERFVNHYANAIGAPYARFEKIGEMPAGAIVIKDSFFVNSNGDVMTGPLFLMQKMEPGFAPDDGDWMYMMYRADGQVVGISGGANAKNVQFCAACHNKAAAGQDRLYFMPSEVRVGR